MLACIMRLRSGHTFSNASTLSLSALYHMDRSEMYEGNQPYYVDYCCESNFLMEYQQLDQMFLEKSRKKI